MAKRRQSDWMLGHKLGHLHGFRDEAPVSLGPGKTKDRGKRPARNEEFWVGYQTGYADGAADRRVATAAERSRAKRRVRPVSRVAAATAARCPSRSARGFHCARSTDHGGRHRNRRWSWGLSGHAERPLKAAVK
jgi:hypothetical protein